MFSSKKFKSKHLPFSYLSKKHKAQSNPLPKPSPIYPITFRGYDLFLKRFLTMDEVFNLQSTMSIHLESYNVFKSSNIHIMFHTGIYDQFNSSIFDQDIILYLNKRYLVYYDFHLASFMLKPINLETKETSTSIRPLLAARSNLYKVIANIYTI